MSSFDFDLVERELNVVVPDVFRDFMERAFEIGLPFEDRELQDNAQSLIEQHNAVKEGYPELWQDRFLVIAPDGCGNYFVLDASSTKVDEMLIVAHDPYGIEDFCPASEFFAGYLESV